MNGTNLNNNNQPKLTPKNKKKRYDRIQNFKLFFCVLTTNLLLFFFMYQSDTPLQNHLTEQLPLKKNHRIFEIPLNISFPLDEKMLKIPISIYNQNKKLIIQKGYLHQPSSRKQNSNYGHLPKFKVEIHEKDFKKIVQNQENTLYAYPYSGFSTQVNLIKRKANYEISF